MLKKTMTPKLTYKALITNKDEKQLILFALFLGVEMTYVQTEIMYKKKFK